MRKLVLSALTAVALAAMTATAQDSKSVVDQASKTMGAAALTSIQYSGSGSSFALGQSPNPNAPWPRFNVTSYTAVINYDTPGMRQEIVRTQGENPPRGGGGQPLAGEQRLVQLVSGNRAWNMTGTTANPTLAATDERLLQIRVSPHGVLKGAMTNPATVKPQTSGGKNVNVVSFTANGRKFNAFINDQNLVERVETWLDNPVLGDMLVETSYSAYKDFGGVQFPTRITQKQGGFPVLELTITDVKPNATADLSVPLAVQQAQPAPVKVDVQKVADGIWFLAGGSHHSIAIEFADHIVVIEGPQNDERSIAVIDEVKKAIPGKPIKYLVNTHHHFDHSGGIRTYAAEGATILTHQMNKAYYEKTFAAPRTLNPDRLAKSGKKATFETMTDKRVLSDGTRTVELHLIKGNPHNDAIIMAYLPKEKLLIEADAFTPPAPNAPPTTTVNPFTVNLYENIERLKLDVSQIAPIHGRLVTMDDLRKAIGKTTSTQ